MAPFAAEGCKLFVYGISQHISNSELQEEFEKFGTVNDTYNTGKGYAFVTYDCAEEASDATNKLDGTTIFGQQIKVNVARPKNTEAGGGGYRSGGGGYGGGGGGYGGGGGGGFGERRGGGRGRGGYGGYNRDGAGHDRRGGFQERGYGGRGGGRGYGGGRGGGYREWDNRNRGNGGYNGGNFSSGQDEGY